MDDENTLSLQEILQHAKEDPPLRDYLIGVLEAEIALVEGNLDLNQLNAECQRLGHVLEESSLDVARKKTLFVHLGQGTLDLARAIQEGSPHASADQLRSVLAALWRGDAGDVEWATRGAGGK